MSDKKFDIVPVGQRGVVAVARQFAITEKLLKRVIRWHEHSIELTELKDWQRLLDWCRKWTKSEPENYSAWHRLGDAFTYLFRHDEAIDAYRQAIRINPEDAIAWNYLGLAYNSFKRYNEANNAAEKLQHLDPEMAENLFNIIARTEHNR